MKKLSCLIVMLLVLSSAVCAWADSKYNYVSYSELKTILEDLEQESGTKSPDVFHVETFGYTYLGNPMYAVKFSLDTTTDDESKPDVLLCNGIHGDEWVPSELSIRLLKHFFNSYYYQNAADHEEVVELVNNHEIWIIPILNPDGREKDEGDVKDGDPETVTNWRKNVQPIVCPEDASAVGVDLNRTFTQGFNPNSVCTKNTYNGGFPFYAPESRWMKKFTNNHMINLSLEGHTTLQAVMSASGELANGGPIVEELTEIYNQNLTDPRLFIEGLVTYTKSGGQYFTWLYFPADYEPSPDYMSSRSIQSILLEWGIPDSSYGCPEEGKIGKYACNDQSNGSHITSADLMDLYYADYVDMAKYLIRQSETPFAPRFHEDMAFRPECPESDLALVGAKISTVGRGKPGCLAVDSEGWDILSHGIKQIIFNVQNNGKSSRDVGCLLTICNRSDDPTCENPEQVTFNAKHVPPYGVKTFTHTADFNSGKEYVVTMQMFDEASPLDDDLKRYIFRVTSDLFGTVKDSDTGAPLTKALVVIKGEAFLKRTWTDDNGFFEVDLDRLRSEGAYHVSVWKQGYQITRKEFQFDGAPVEMSIELEKCVGNVCDPDVIHEKILTVDSHVDTPLLLSDGLDLSVAHDPYECGCKVDFPRMKEGGLDAIFFAVWTRQGPRTPEGNESAKQAALNLFDAIHESLSVNSDLAELALTPGDVYRIEEEGKRAIFIGMENGYPIGDDLSLIQTFYDLGARYITLCHSKNNDICDASTDKEGPEHYGLSDFGREVVAEMNRIGMLVDVSHISDKAFYDVLEVTNVPVIASHSGARAIYDHPRNMSDDMLRELTANRGVIQVDLLYVKESNPTVADVVDHIDYIVEIAGIDHVGIGSDFDGGAEVEGCFDVSEMTNITRELAARGYNGDQIRKIWGGNLMRVLHKVESERGD